MMPMTELATNPCLQAVTIRLHYGGLWRAGSNIARLAAVRPDAARLLATTVLPAFILGLMLFVVLRVSEGERGGRNRWAPPALPEGDCEPVWGTARDAKRWTATGAIDLPPDFVRVRQLTKSGGGVP